MKNFLLALVLIVMSLTASAQSRRPRLPIPPINVGVRCTVVMIDNWHRVLRSFSGRSDIITGQCRTPMNQCRQSLPRRGRGLRCVDRRGRW